MAAGAAVFDRVVKQVLEQLDQLVALSDDGRQARRGGQLERDAVDLRQRAQGGERLTYDGFERDAPRGTDVLVELDPGQRKKILDQPAHAARFDRHDVEEAVA